MPKGAKKGENRFKSSQTKRKEFRVDRIRSLVLPRIKTLAGRAVFKGKTHFCKHCADIFNENLPVNEYTLGYRTLEQNFCYWELLGPVFYQHWGGNDEIKKQHERVQRIIVEKESAEQKFQIERLDRENQVLRSALRMHGANENLGVLPDPTSESNFTADFDRVCRALEIVINASDGIFEVDNEAMKLCFTSDDLEPPEGLVPKAIAEPFIHWLKTKREKTGGIS